MKNYLILTFLLSSLSFAQSKHENNIQSCQSQSANGCFELAMDFLQGRSVQADSKQAVKYLLKSCDLGRYEGCEVAAYGVSQGMGNLEKNEKLAIDYLERACTEGYLSSCDKGLKSLRNYAKNHNIYDEQQYQRFLQNSCYKGQVHACKILAMTYSDGASYYYSYGNKVYSNAVNSKEALKIAEFSCPYKDDYLCALGFSLTSDASSETYNLDSSFFFADRLCQLQGENAIQGCRFLGWNFLIAKDYNKALPYFNDYCEAGDMQSCKYMADVYHGLNKNSDANALYNQACDAKNADSCEQLGYDFYLQSDYKKANNYYAKACKLGLKELCDYSKELNDFVVYQKKVKQQEQTLNDILQNQSINSAMDYAVMQEGSRELAKKVLNHAKNNNTLSKLDDYWFESIVTWFDSSSSEGQLIHRIRKDRGTNNYARTSGGTNKIGMASARSTSRSIKSYNARPSTYQAPKPIKSSAQISQQTYKTVHAYYCQTGGTKDC